MNTTISVSSGDAGPSWSTISLQIGLIIFLTLLNAMFSATEMAMVSLDKSKLDADADEGDAKAKKILKLLSDPSKFLSTIQLSITLAGFFSSASAATGISRILGTHLEDLGLPSAYTLSTIVITLILSYLTIVFGELVPKRAAMANPEAFARSIIGPVSVLSVILSPVVKLLSASTNGVLKLMGLDTEGVEERVTLNDIKSLVQVGQQQGLINRVESEMINSVITFDDKYAEDIMTARPDVFMIEVDQDPNEYIDEMMNLKYSRIPVYKDEVDNIIGVLYIKDYLLASYKVGFENVDLEKILRPAFFVPERKNINELFNEMQSDNKHMALLIDEYGGFAGIVTMEDLIEEIVGDIDDEYDQDIPELIKIDENHFICEGSLSIKEFNYHTGLEIDEDTEDFDTLAGLIIFTLGRIPNDGERPFLEFDDMRAYVLLIEEKRIKKVRIELIEKEESEEK